MARNQLARLIAGVSDRDRLNLTGSFVGAGTDEETAVTGLPDFTTEGYVLQLIINGDGDLVASWQDVAGGGGGSGKYRDLIYELDGMGGFDFITDDDGNPMYVLADLE